MRRNGTWKQGNIDNEKAAKKKTMENEKTRMENEEVEKWKKIGVKKMRMRSNGKWQKEK